jgi:hypothetical protein
MFDFGAKRIFLWTSVQAPIGDIGEKGLPRISPCGAEADMPLKWISDAAGKKRRAAEFSP